MKTYIHLLSGLDVIVERDSSGGFVAVVPGLPGCGSQGEAIGEVLENLNDAIMAVLTVLREDDPEHLQDIFVTPWETIDEDAAYSTATIDTLVSDEAAA